MTAVDEASLSELVDDVLARVEWQPGWAAGLEGSLAEGFGNDASDLDLVLIDPADADPPAMPAVLFSAGRRVEVRVRSAGQLRAEFRLLAARRRRPSALSEDLLDRCQRLLGARWLRNRDVADTVLRPVRAQLPGGFASLAAGWWAHSARQSLRQAVASAVLGQEGDAAEWARNGLVQVVKSWAARRGETYVEPKWLALQLTRIGEPAVAHRFESLYSRRGSARAEDYVTACVAFARDLGVTGLERERDRLHLDRMPDVTSWPVQGRMHVIRNRREVFALGETAGQVWRSVVFGQTLPQALVSAQVAASSGDDVPGALLADFLRYGLLRLRSGSRTVDPRSPYAAPSGPMNPPPSTVTPLIGLGGAPVPGPAGVALLPVPGTGSRRPP